LTHTRQLHMDDFPRIIRVIDEWWGGRKMTHLLQRLFFTHFSNTSYVIEQDGQIIAFLIGFMSQAKPGEAYIHFVGVHPDFRTQGLARQLYRLFFESCKSYGCHQVRAVTSPVNQTSIAFHRKMGFHLEPSGTVRDGVPVHPDYDGPGNDRVLFVKMLEA
jgi:GNAT superfamily N-acetyltransferase